MYKKEFKKGDRVVAVRDGINHGHPNNDCYSYQKGDKGTVVSEGHDPAIKWDKNNKTEMPEINKIEKIDKTNDKEQEKFEEGDRIIAVENGVNYINPNRDIHSYKAGDRGKITRVKTQRNIEVKWDKNDKKDWPDIDKIKKAEYQNDKEQKDNLKFEEGDKVEKIAEDDYFYASKGTKGQIIDIDQPQYPYLVEWNNDQDNEYCCARELKKIEDKVNVKCKRKHKKCKNYEDIEKYFVYNDELYIKVMSNVAIKVKNGRKIPFAGKTKVRKPNEVNIEWS